MKKVLAFYILSLVYGTISAQQNTQDFTFDVAEDFCEQNALMAQSGGPDGLMISYTISREDNTDLHVYTRGTNKGYVIVNVDPNAPTVVGYSDKGSFDPDQIPEEMNWWIRQYSFETMENASNRAPMIRMGESPITPMIETHWDQHDPYNRLCPMVGSERTLAGCVAISMAQVMYYHKWPVHGKGSNTDIFDNTLSVNFGAATYRWDKMLTSYSSYDSDDACNAVATLVYHCGVAANMSYGLSFSGAFSYFAAQAFSTYFDYKSSIQYVSRSDYSDQDWERLIYSELASGHPVIYGGTNPDSDGAHSFICDGYDGNGYFHFNWGWGYLDGYYLMTGSNPLNVYGNSGYSLDQDAIIGIVPNGTYVPDDEDDESNSGEDEEGKVGGHEYVDLGLPSGTLWSTMNYGALSETGYGNYFDWSSSDVIKSYWGDGWRTPSLTDCKELINKCSWTWGKKNGVNGYTVKGPNGNAIFLPAAGFKIMGYDQSLGSMLCYWSSTASSQSGFSYAISCFESSVDYSSYNTSISQFPIRPVHDKLADKATSVKLGVTNVSLNVGDTYTLNASATPSGASQLFSWKSSNVDVATVADGVVTAVGAGTATITVATTDGSNLSTSCTVTVTDNRQMIGGHEYVDLGLPSGILWSTMNYGATSKTAYGSYVLWSSSDVVTTDWGNGWSSPTYDNLVELLRCPRRWVTIDGVNGYEVTGWNGNTIFLPASGYQMMYSSVKQTGTNLRYWTSTISDSYDGDDFVYVLSATSTSANINSQSTSMTLLPIRPVHPSNNVKVTSITLSNSSLTMTEGDSQTISAVIYPDNATKKSVNWSSSNTSVATVSNGVITAIAPGTATITASATDGSGKSAICVVTVKARTVLVSSISLSCNSIDMIEGDSQTILATVYPNEATNKSVNWSSSNTSVATVSNGVITAIAPGTATITVSATDGSGKSAICVVTVKARTVLVSSISLSCNSIDMTEGDSQTILATVYPNEATNKTVSWSSSNTSVATVSNGVITAIALGTATITASATDGSGKSAICVVTVRARTVLVSSISLSCNSIDMTEGDSQTILATVYPSNASNKTINWSSSNSGVVAVSNGKVTAVEVGTAIITASANDGSGVSAKCTITVSEYKSPNMLCIWQSDGKKVFYALTDRPKILMTSEDLVLKTGQTKILWPLSDYMKCTFELMDTSIDTMNNTSLFNITENHLNASGLVPNSVLSISNMQGQIRASLKVDYNGCASIPLFELEGGTYIIKTDNITFKFYKQ